MERTRNGSRHTSPERAASHATVLLLAFVWLAACMDPGTRARVARPSPKGDMKAALAPLAVDPWRDPPWRLRLIPGIGAQRSAEIVTARSATQEAPWHSFRGLIEAPGLGAGTLRALWAARAEERAPDRVPVVRIRLSPWPRGSPLPASRADRRSAQ